MPNKTVMKVQAKFKVNSITKLEGSEIWAMQPVIGDSEENKSWSKWTPAGSLSMTVTNTDLFNKFNAGDEFLITLNKVKK